MRRKSPNHDESGFPSHDADPHEEIDPNAETGELPGHHPLDDDDELAHIGEYTPPPIEVSPDSDTRTARDAPPPMVRSQDDPLTGADVHIPPISAPASQQDSGEDEHTQPRPPTRTHQPKIRTFEQRLGRGGHETMWKRNPNLTGTGAIHVKSFHCKLTGDSLEFLDSQINEWLDEHPEYEVKFVTTSVGEWTGKLKEPSLIVNVWV